MIEGRGVGLKERGKEGKRNKGMKRKEGEKNWGWRDGGKEGKDGVREGMGTRGQGRREYRKQG